MKRFLIAFILVAGITAYSLSIPLVGGKMQLVGGKIQFAAGAPPAGPEYPEFTNSMARYYFNTDETKTTDNSGNGFTLGAFFGGAAWSNLDGDGCAYFDGVAAYVSTPANGSYDSAGNMGLKGDSNWTVVIWYRGEDTRNGSDEWNGQPLLGHYGWWASLSMRTGFPMYTHYAGSYARTAATNAITDNQWHQVVQVNNPPSASLFIDGSNKVTGGSEISGGGEWYQITDFGKSPYVSGFVDHVTISVTNWSDAAVAESYHRGRTNNL